MKATPSPLCLQVERPVVRRLAQGVRSREEPEESFLKGVPTDPGRLEIVYPVSRRIALSFLEFYVLQVICVSSSARLIAIPSNQPHR